jgi:hypothetical protein
MTLSELIERLEEIRDDYDVSGDTPIRGAFQPSYPLIAGIAAITTVIDDDADNAGIYIALGDGCNYGSRDLWNDELVEREDDEDDED